MSKPKFKVIINDVENDMEWMRTMEEKHRERISKKEELTRSRNQKMVELINEAILL